MIKRIPIACIIIATMLLIGFGTAAALNSSASQPAPRKASTLPTPPPTCGYCTTELLDMSPEEIGVYVVDIEKTYGEVTNGTPEVLLSRIITRDDYSDLGLGCLPDYSSIEDAPLALVILKGDVRYRGPEYDSFTQESQYAVIVLDMWAGGVTAGSFSQEGEGLGKVLNDPAYSSNEPRQCGERAPRSLHYGETAPGIHSEPPPYNTFTPAESATLTAGPTNPVPATPIGGLPTVPRPEPTKNNSAP